MMNFSFFFIVTLTLIICQTVLLPGFSWFPQSFDLLIIVVLYLSLYSARPGVIFCIVIIGAVMDSLSGVPFFLHIFSYLWVYMIVQVLTQFVFQRSVVFMIVVSLLSVSIQQGLILFSIFLSRGQLSIVDLDYSLVAKQILWGVLVIPPGVWVLNLLRQNYVYLIRQFRRNLIRRYRG